MIDNYNEETYHRNSYAQQKHTEKSFLFRSGKLKFTASIPRSSYFPGEIVPITLHITNETSKQINDIRVGMTRVVEQKPRLYGIYSKSAQTISSYSTKKQINENSTVPAMTIEYLLSSDKPWGPSLSLKHFDLSYMISVVLVPKGLACNLSLEFPIVIVTPPLKLQSNSLIAISPFTSSTEGRTRNSSSTTTIITRETQVEYDHIVNEDGFVEFKRLDSNNPNITTSNNNDSNAAGYHLQNNSNIPPPYNAVPSPQFVPQYVPQYAPQYAVEMNQNMSLQYSPPPYHGAVNENIMNVPPPQLNERLNHYPIIMMMDYHYSP